MNANFVVCLTGERKNLWGKTGFQRILSSGSSIPNELARRCDSATYLALIYHTVWRDNIRAGTNYQSSVFHSHTS